MSAAPKGKWGEGRRRPELCSLVTTKFHQNFKIKLNNPPVYIKIVVHLDRNGN